MGVLTPCDRTMIASLVRRAADNGLVERPRISAAAMGTELRTTFYAEVFCMYRCLADMRKDADCAGQQLRATIEQVKTIGQYIVDKEERELKVAPAKSVVKIQVSLAPVIDGVLGAIIDVVAGLTVGLPGGAAAVVRYVVDPADLAAARQVLVMVGNVKDRLSPRQAEKLSPALQPFESAVALGEQLGSVATVFDCGGTEPEGGAKVVGDSAGDGEASKAASDAGGDPLEYFTGATWEAAIGHGGDKADELRNRTASRPPIPPATDLPPSAGGGGCATPPPPFASPSSVPTATATASHAPLSAGAACSAATPAALPAPPTAPAAGSTAPRQPPAAAS